jgi:hypothetical protein
MVRIGKRLREEISEKLKQIKDAEREMYVQEYRAKYPGTVGEASKKRAAVLKRQIRKMWAAVPPEYFQMAREERIKQMRKRADWYGYDLVKKDKDQ